MAATRDVREGHRIEHTDAGIRIYETIVVPNSDLTGSASEKLHSALSVSGVPARGDAHPTISGLQAIRITGALGQLGEVTLSVEWGTPETESDNATLESTGILEIFGSVQSETRVRDINDNLMIVTWSGTLLDIFPDGFAANNVTWIEHAEAEVNVPSYGYQLTRRINSATPVLTGDIAAVDTLNTTYTGKVNSLTYSGKAPRTLLMMDIRGDNRNPEDIRAVFRMAYRPQTWDQEVIVRPYGRIPQNLNTPAGNGFATFQHYSEVDFNGLPVSF